jgi:hypothetical protein
MPYRRQPRGRMATAQHCARSVMVGLFMAMFCYGGSIPVGYLSFAADSPLAGQTSFNLVNATGALGCTVDAPVCDELLLDGVLTIDYGLGEIVTAPLSVNLGAGSWLPSEFIFNDARTPWSAKFSGSTKAKSVVLFDGTTQAINGIVTGSANDLGSAPELILYTESVPIPEPATLSLMAAALLTFFTWRRFAA